jgi:hypothetical protein
MPSVPAILSHLTAVANDAAVMAVVWHIIIAAAVVALSFGWRPSRRLAGVLLAAPVASAATVAFAFRNPFNGTILAILALALVGLACRFRSGHVVRGSLWMTAAGTFMVAFGLFYPHFLTTQSALAYLYAAPTGLIPCPTVSVIIGFALIAGGLRTRAWSLVLGTFGLFYGVFGVVRLHVLLDVPLVLGAVALIVVALLEVDSGSIPSTSTSTPRASA